MIFSAIAGWFVRRLWPNGVLIAVAIALANSFIQFFRTEATNSNRVLMGDMPYPNGVEIVAAGFLIDALINVAIFAIVWTIRRKIKPHSTEASSDDHSASESLER